MSQSVSSRPGGDSGVEQGRRELSLRLDDLRGFGLLPPGDGSDMAGEEALIALCLDLVDSLESTQRRVIETSIQILSLRELVAKLLSLRTPEQVAETVTLYLQKAFDHERVLVGVYHAPDLLEGWVGLREGESSSHPFRLTGEWDGALRTVLERGRGVRATTAGDPPFLRGSGIPAELDGFREEGLGPYLAYPLRGSGQKEDRTVGVLLVGRRPEETRLDEMDEGILESVVEAVGTALENVILEEDIRREEAFRKDIMRSMSSGLIAVDLSGRVLTLNAMAEEMTGFRLGALRGESLGGFEAAGGSLGELLEKTIRTRTPIPGVERAVRRIDGSAFPASCSTTLLRNPEGDVYGAVITFNDLTEIKRMQHRIRALDRLAALGRFTAGMAHEIRNPLTGIGTGIQYLERHATGDARQDENLKFIRREIDRLNRIVEDLFRVTHPHPVRKVLEDPRAMMERAIQALGDQAAARGIEVVRRFDEPLPEVGVDPDQIQQVLLNLLKNAVEASSEGGEVVIHLYPSRNAARPQMVFQIADSGPGIPAESLGKVFEPFFTEGKPNGTGLGLYVSHGIVERHGGELHAANATGGGAIFTLMLPLDTYDMTEKL